MTPLDPIAAALQQILSDLQANYTHFGNVGDTDAENRTRVYVSQSGTLSVPALQTAITGAQGDFTTLQAQVQQLQSQIQQLQAAAGVMQSERTALINEVSAVKAALALPVRATQTDIVNAINAKTALAKQAPAAGTTAPKTVSLPVAGAVAVGGAGVGFLGGYIVRGMVDKRRRGSARAAAPAAAKEPEEE